MSRGLLRFSGVLLYWAIAASISFLCICGAVLYFYSLGLPNHNSLTRYEFPQVTRAYDGNGDFLAEYYKEYRMYTPINRVPQLVIEAFLAAEDKNFYTNPGIDLFGIFRAFVVNVLHVGSNKRMVGGSTITQQVVKNFLLSNERTFSRKIKEMILAHRISNSLSKDKILEFYLNYIYLGNGSYGVSAAAMSYFDKSLRELSIEEAALLAALPKAPSKLDPFKNPEGALGRRNWVLQRMFEEGFIGEVDNRSAQSVGLNLKSGDLRVATDQASEFVAEEVRRAMAGKYGDNQLYEGGMTIHSTVKPFFQNAAFHSFRRGVEEYDMRHGWRGALFNVRDVGGEAWQDRVGQIRIDRGVDDGWNFAVVKSFDKSGVYIETDLGNKGKIALQDMLWARKWITVNSRGPALISPSDILSEGDVVPVQKIKSSCGVEDCYALKQVPKVNGGMIVMDAYTGRILAMVGGYDYRSSKFNRAVQAMRQSGSVFKPFVYLAALNKGLMPNTIVMDDPITIDFGPKLGTWTPKNYGGNFLGPVTLRRAFELSRNLATIRIAQYVGLKDLMNLSKELGVYNQNIFNYAAILGSGTITLQQIVGGYAAIVNGGKVVDGYLVEKVQDRNGNVLYSKDYVQCELCGEVPANSPLFSMLIPSIPEIKEKHNRIIDPVTAYQMVSLMEGGVRRGTAKLSYIKGKHIGGKTGTTNNSMDAWFVGFMNNIVVGVYVGHDSPESLGDKETGARVALPIFKYFAKEYFMRYKSKPFPVPIGINFVDVDMDTGMPMVHLSSRLKGSPIKEALRVGSEDVLRSIIEYEHYYDYSDNRWVVIKGQPEEEDEEKAS